MPTVFEQATTSTPWADDHIAQGVWPMRLTFAAAGIDWGQMITDKPTNGVKYTHPPGLLFEQMVNRTTEQRSQLPATFTTAGNRPGDINLLYYLRHKSSYATGSVV